ncbi:hypothetical protein J3458_004200 [Metarhizium acridum]|uniref:uncharacterized protein n=1 Tax=Metarhizium acridum TaxID=92637 RepID=UPI001C6BAAD6|nr:hypothetical protein J3458_004200 [Metarhizium acridum]
MGVARPNNLWRGTEQTDSDVTIAMHLSPDASHHYRDGRPSLRVLPTHNIEWPNMNLSDGTSPVVDMHLLNQPYTDWGIGIGTRISSATPSSQASDTHFTQQHTRHT